MSKEDKDSTCLLFISLQWSLFGDGIVRYNDVLQKSGQSNFSKSTIKHIIWLRKSKDILVAFINAHWPWTQPHAVTKALSCQGVAGQSTSANASVLELLAAVKRVVSLDTQGDNTHLVALSLAIQVCNGVTISEVRGYDQCFSIRRRHFRGTDNLLNKWKSHLRRAEWMCWKQVLYFRKYLTR